MHRPAELLVNPAQSGPADGAVECFDYMQSAADEIGELIGVLAPHIQEHGTAEVSLVARGILHRINALAFEIYNLAYNRSNEHEGDLERFRDLLAPPGQLTV